MARTRTLQNLRADVRYQADVEGQTDRHEDFQLTRLINQSYARFREIISEAGHPYYLTTDTGSTVAGTATLTLPADFVAAYGLDLTISGEKRTIYDHEFAERNDFENAEGRGIPVSYRIQASSTLTLVPVPDAAYAYALWYLPVHDELTANDDAVDGINGWEDWIVYDAALKMLARDDDAEQAAQIYALKMQRERDIRSVAGKRSRAGPARRIDTRARRRRNEWLSRNRVVVP